MTIAEHVAALVEAVDCLDVLVEEGHELPEPFVEKVAERLDRLTRVVQAVVVRVERQIVHVAKETKRGKRTKGNRPFQLPISRGRSGGDP